MIRFSPVSNRAHLIRWREWGEEAFAAARSQNKPIMLFIAAFWCGYCQRMDEEAFSDDEAIAILNAFFVSIRVEEGQRPDVSLRYNLNGWPTVAFITAEGELLGVTNYQPRENFAGMLARIYKAYHERQAATDSTVQSRSETPTAGSPVSESMQLKLVQTVETVLRAADSDHGGYGNGQKFIQPEPNDFLLSVYRSSHEPLCLDHVRLTLDRMRAGAIYDHQDGGYFRTCSNPDWSKPHREKLLREQAGILRNCVHMFGITADSAYLRMAEEIVDYIERRLSAPNGSFFGCEDFLRKSGRDSTDDKYVTITDECIYADANAETAAGYLQAGEAFQRADYIKRATQCLEFIWEHCTSTDGAVSHSYFKGSKEGPTGLLNDQSAMGAALLAAHRSTGNSDWLTRAKLVGEFIESHLKNPEGGYFDSAEIGPGYLRLRLTLIEQNGAAASFFLRLAQITGENNYREKAAWALGAFPEPAAHGIHAASFGRALNEYLYGRF